MPSPPTLPQFHLHTLPTDCATSAPAGFFDATDPLPQLLLAPNTGMVAGRLIVLKAGGGCSEWARGPRTNLWTSMALMDINYDGNQDVLLTSAHRVRAAHAPGAVFAKAQRYVLVLSRVTSYSQQSGRTCSLSVASGMNLGCVRHFVEGGPMQGNSMP